MVATTRDRGKNPGAAPNRMDTELDSSLVTARSALPSLSRSPDVIVYGDFSTSYSIRSPSLPVPSPNRTPSKPFEVEGRGYMLAISGFPSPFRSAASIRLREMIGDPFGVG